MTDLTIYLLKSCDTCRKAVKALQAAGHTLTQIDVRADGVPADALSAMADNLGWEALLNTRSTTWRGLDDSDKTDMTREKALLLIAAHPTLMKRPVVSDGQVMTLGWKADAQDVWL